MTDRSARRQRREVRAVNTKNQLRSQQQEILDLLEENPSLLQKVTKELDKKERRKARSTLEQISTTSPLSGQQPPATVSAESSSSASSGSDANINIDDVEVTQDNKDQDNKDTTESKGKEKKAAAVEVDSDNDSDSELSSSDDEHYDDDNSDDEYSSTTKTDWKRETHFFAPTGKRIIESERFYLRSKYKYPRPLFKPTKRDTSGLTYQIRNKQLKRLVLRDIPIAQSKVAKILNILAYTQETKGLSTLDLDLGYIASDLFFYLGTLQRKVVNDTLGFKPTDHPEDHSIFPGDHKPQKKYRPQSNANNKNSKRENHFFERQHNKPKWKQRDHQQKPNSNSSNNSNNSSSQA